MPKPKLSDFKKFIGEMTESDLRAELLKLFGKLPQVQEFYAQELMNETERKAMLDEYKRKIYSQFWTRNGNPRFASNAELRRLISDFEKVCVFPHELVDLLLYRVEIATENANSYGGMPDADYNAASTAFEKALKLMKQHKLEEHFRARCTELFRYDNVDFWYIERLEELFNEYIVA